MLYSSLLSSLNDSVISLSDLQVFPHLRRTTSTSHKPTWLKNFVTSNSSTSKESCDSVFFANIAFVHEPTCYT